VDDVLGNHRLAEALRRDEDDVACFGQEAELEYGVDEVAAASDCGDSGALASGAASPTPE
jgi:hypothetical protein